MARPPVEWPIPVYVTELRARVVAVFRVPPCAVAPRVPAPVTAESAQGHGIVALALDEGRCLKSVGAHPVLAGEFRAAQLWTPARWQGACRPPLRGSFLLALAADRASLCRLGARALQVPVAHLPVWQGAVGAAYRCAGGDEGNPAWRFDIPRPGGTEAIWPAASIFATAEDAEGALLHPQAALAPSGDGSGVLATPVRHYARSTVPVEVAAWSAPWVARLLGLSERELALDHVVLQRRCTHTWAYPPERIPRAWPGRDEAARGAGRLNESKPTVPTF